MLLSRPPDTVRMQLTTPDPFYFATPPARSHPRAVTTRTTTTAPIPLALLLANWSPADEAINQYLVSVSQSNEGNFFSIEARLFLEMRQAHLGQAIEDEVFPGDARGTYIGVRKRL